jgi:diguanylate cyclase (GGDEF)-like protein/PAS domain S-box-containing protein
MDDKKTGSIQNMDDWQALIIDSVPVQMWFLTDETTYGSVNQCHADFVGKAKSEIENRKLIDLFPADVAAMCEQSNQAVLESKKTVVSEEWVADSCGIQHLLEITKTPVLDSKGNIKYIACFALDVTVRHEANESQRQYVKHLSQNEMNYRMFLESSHDIVIVADTEGRLLFANAAASAKLGYPPDMLKNMRIGDLHPAWVRKEVEEIVTDMLAGRRASCPLPLITRDGAVIPVETRVSLGVWNGKECIFGISKDLSVEQEALQKFERLFGMNPALMAVSMLPDRRFVEVNAAFLRTLGYSADEVLGKTSAELGLFANPDQQQHVAANLLEYGRIEEAELQVKTKDGTIRDGLFSGEIIESQGKRYFLTVMIDITERKRLEAKLVEQTVTDELTGINNRRGFIMLAQLQLKMAKRDKTDCLLFFIDLDGMKRLNDGFGHTEGDRALIEVTRILKGTFRESDVIARVGGDEFVVLARRFNDGTQETLRNRLDAALVSHNSALDRTYELSLSVGVASYSFESNMTLDELMKQADACMYEDKARHHKFRRN